MERVTQMEQLKQRLEAVLHEQLPGCQAVLNVGPYSDKIAGFLAWDGFNGLEPIDRLRKLSQTIRAHFSDEDQGRISLIVTLTPAEYAVYRREQATDRQPLAA